MIIMGSMAQGEPPDVEQGKGGEGFLDVDDVVLVRQDIHILNIEHMRMVMALVIWSSTITQLLSEKTHLLYTAPLVWCALGIQLCITQARTG